jgi:hypothetical protein
VTNLKINLPITANKATIAIKAITVAILRGYLFFRMILLFNQLPLVWPS